MKLLEYEILKDQLDNGANGILILNKDKRLIYQNNIAKKVFHSKINNYLGNYIKCNNTVREMVDCQNTSKCNICILNFSINKVIETGKTQKLNNISLDTNMLGDKVSLEIRLVLDKIIIEFIDGSEKSRQVNVLSNLIDKSDDIMYYKDFKLRYLAVNNRCSKAFNVKKEDMLYSTDKELFRKDLMDKKTYEAIVETDISTLEKGYYTGVEKHDGKYFNVFKEAIDDGILCISKEITEEVEATKNSEVDELTGLANRRRLTKDIDYIFSKKTNGYYFALFDLDNLRGINNTLGHLVGDRYLRLLSEVFLMSKNAKFFRLGGDEFAALIKGSKFEVESIITGVFSKLEELETEIPITISVGAKTLDINKLFFETYQDVDELMYKVKNNGKNGYIIE